MPKNRLALLAVALVTVAACGGATTSSSPSASPPSASESPSPSSPGGIAHPAGADEVVLRLEEGGGMQMVEWVAAAGPIFTLYGDGTAIFRNPADLPPESDDGFIRGTPWKVARLSEPQVQELLLFAINDGALGIAREKYENNQYADASTTTFTISAEGTTKRVEAYALMEAGETGADAVVRGALSNLASWLKDFEAQADVTAAEYEPTAYRAVLIESQAAAPSPWPWPGLTVADFEKPAGEEFGLPRRALTLDEMGQLGVADPEGTVTGIHVEGTDGKVYSVAIRPLFPDEES